jgi:hypothetical protein
MPRAARALTAVCLALLVLLEATPTVARIRIPSAGPRRCEIAASRHRVTMVAALSERSTAPAATAREVLVPSSLPARKPRVADLEAGGRSAATAVARRSFAWLRVHRQRARAPDDPDPL